MTLPLTPDTLEAAYEYLRSTPPFAGWNLPEGDEVKFFVVKDRRAFGRYRWDGKRHTISMSANCIGQSRTLIEKMGHEMIHLHLEDAEMESRGTEHTHNAWFRRLADEACAVHGWDVKGFY